MTIIDKTSPRVATIAELNAGHTLYAMLTDERFWDLGFVLLGERNGVELICVYKHTY